MDHLATGDALSIIIIIMWRDERVFYPKKTSTETTVAGQIEDASSTPALFSNRCESASGSTALQQTLVLHWSCGR